MRDAEKRYSGYPDSISELMERAGEAFGSRGDARVPGCTELRLRVRRRLERGRWASRSTHPS